MIKRGARVLIFPRDWQVGSAHRLATACAQHEHATDSQKVTGDILITPATEHGVQKRVKEGLVSPATTSKQHCESKIRSNARSDTCGIVTNQEHKSAKAVGSNVALQPTTHAV